VRLSKLSDLELLTREELEELADDGGPDPFEVLKDIGTAGLLNYIHQKHGSEALVTTIKLLANTNSARITREWLEEQAEELEALELLDGASIIRKRAKNTPPLAASILADNDRCYVKSRLAYHHRRSEFGPASMDYINENANAEDIEFMNRAKGNATRRVQ
jgi:hypothetical protein